MSVDLLSADKVPLAKRVLLLVVPSPVPFGESVWALFGLVADDRFVVLDIVGKKR